MNDAERNRAGDDGWSQRKIGNNHHALKVAPLRHVEIEIVEIGFKMNLANIVEQEIYLVRLGSGCVIFTEHEFFPVSSLIFLNVILDAWKFGAD